MVTYIKKVELFIRYTNKKLLFLHWCQFSDVWTQADSNNAENTMLHMGYVIVYAVCPVLWCSKPQTEASVSTTEA